MFAGCPARLQTQVLVIVQQALFTELSLYPHNTEVKYSPHGVWVLLLAFTTEQMSFGETRLFDLRLIDTAL